MVIDTSTRARRVMRRITIGWGIAAGVFAPLALAAAAAGLRATALAAAALTAAAAGLSGRAALAMRRQRDWARAQRTVRQQLNAVARSGWTIETDLAWVGRGRIVCAARSRTGIGFAIEPVDRVWGSGHAELARHKAAWLAGERWARSVVPIVCVAGATSRKVVTEGGVIVCPAEQLVNALRRSERESLLTGLRASGEPLVARLAR